MKNILYYESHITIEPVNEVGREIIARVILPYNFKLAKLLMQKRDDDTLERSKFDTFCTGHGSDEADIVQRMADCVRALQENGFKVWRYKIECVTIDSRNKDSLGLL